MACGCSSWVHQSTKLLPEQTVEQVPNETIESLSSEHPGLGMLSRLPGEIRNMIWREFFPKNLYKPWRADRKLRDTQLTVLRTSRCLYQEVGSQIYPIGLHPFVISITPEYPYESWATLSNGKKDTATWSLDLQNFGWRSFSGMGRGGMAFRVEIEAPDRDDGGQFICLLRKVTEAVHMLHEMSRPPHRVEIKFKDGKKGRWFDGGKGTVTNIGGKPCDPDYQHMLLPFLQLRRINRPAIKAPSGVKIDPSHLRVFGNVKWMMKKTVPFGQLEDVKGWSDSSLRSEIQTHGCRCELAFHYMSGPTALMLRLEFFVRYNHIEEILDEMRNPED